MGAVEELGAVEDLVGASARIGPSPATSVTPAARHQPAAVIAGMASSFPLARSQDELWDGYFSARYGEHRWARRVFASTGVVSRHCVVDPLEEDPSAWSTRRRMERYEREAVPLAEAAAERALARAGVDARDVGLLAVVSCTGYATPGVDVRLASRLGLPESARRVVVGHLGCHGALPGLGVVTDYVSGHGRPGVLVCVELASLHVQPATAELDQVVIHALFGDAAAAAVVVPGDLPTGREAPVGVAGPAPSSGRRLAVVDIAAHTVADSEAMMSWRITDHGFRMGLDRRVPDLLALDVGRVVDGLLARHQLQREDVGAWAVHPGGPRILDVVADRLGLDEHDLVAPRAVLAKRGNCSSATLLLVVEEILDRPLATGAPIVALAFGPGLTLYACILRCVS